MSTTDFNQLSKELSGKGGIAGSFLLFLILTLIYCFYNKVQQVEEKVWDDFHV